MLIWLWTLTRPRALSSKSLPGSKLNCFLFLWENFPPTEGKVLSLLPNSDWYVFGIVIIRFEIIPNLNFSIISQLKWKIYIKNFHLHPLRMDPQSTRHRFEICSCNRGFGEEKKNVRIQICFLAWHFSFPLRAPRLTLTSCFIHYKELHCLISRFFGPSQHFFWKLYDLDAPSMFFHDFDQYSASFFCDLLGFPKSLLACPPFLHMYLFKSSFLINIHEEESNIFVCKFTFFTEKLFQIFWVFWFLLFFLFKSFKFKLDFFQAQILSN